MAARGWSLFSLYIYIENLKKKIFLSETTGPISIYLGRNVSLVTLYQDCSSRHDFSKKHGRQGAGLIFPIYIYIKNLKKSSCQKQLDRFQYYLADMFPWWPFTKIVQAIDLSKNMAGRGRGLFSPYIYIENFNVLLVRNHWTDFNLTLQKCFLCNPLSRLCKPSWFIKKQGRQRAGLIFPIYLYRKTLKVFFSETTGPISLQLGKMFPWWPSTKIVQVIMICKKTWLLVGGVYFPYISI